MKQRALSYGAVWNEPRQEPLHPCPLSLHKVTLYEELDNPLLYIAAIPRAVCIGSTVPMVQEESDW